MRLSTAVYSCLPERGEQPITAPTIRQRLAKLGIDRDVRSLTGVLGHLYYGGFAAKAKRKATDDRRIVNRWVRGKKVYSERVRALRPEKKTLDDFANPGALLKHWGIKDAAFLRTPLSAARLITRQ